MMAHGGVAPPRHALRRAGGVQVLEQMGRELLQRWRAVLLTLHRDRHRLRRLVRALWAVGIVFGLGFLYRHRKQIAASVRGGLGRLAHPPAWLRLPPPRTRSGARPPGPRGPPRAQAAAACC